MTLIGSTQASLGLDRRPLGYGGGLTVQTPPTAVHCRAVRHTSEVRQSLSVAATHAPAKSEHLPAKAHCADLLQSALSRATQRPSSA